MTMPIHNRRRGHHWQCERAVLKFLVVTQICFFLGLITPALAFSKTGASVPLLASKANRHDRVKTHMNPRTQNLTPSTTLIYQSSSSSSTDDEETQNSRKDKDTSKEIQTTPPAAPSISTTLQSIDDTTNPSVSGGDPRQNRRIQIAAGLVASIAAMAVAAKLGLLPGPLIENSITVSTASSFQIFRYPGCGEYTNGMIFRDSIATALAAVLAVILVKGITYGKENGCYNSKVGRKLNHTLAAPLFILFFPAFSDAEGARFFAGLVSLSNMLRLYLAGTGQGESSLASTISRSGNKAEVLGGPFIYVCWLQAMIWCFWRSSFVGVVAMATMAAGDGMADLVGRKWGANCKWSFSDGSKSKVGTLAFGVSAFLVNFGLCEWLIATGCLESKQGMTDLAVRLLVISFVTALVELIPFGDDNYTVPGCAALMAALLLH
jgi:phytol kinase